jgi:hypothetical protein
MAPRVIHQVAQGLAPDCAPLLLTDGCKDSLTARLTHYGQWGQPAHQRAHGPALQPRWLSRPGLLSAHVVKTMRRRRVVRVQHRVVCGTLEALQPVLAARGWQSHALPLAFVLELREDIIALCLVFLPNLCLLRTELRRFTLTGSLCLGFL